MYSDSEGTTSEDELSEEMMDDICNEEEDKMTEITSYCCLLFVSMLNSVV